MGSFAKLARRAVETDAPVMVKVMNYSCLVETVSSFQVSWSSCRAFPDDVPFSDTRTASRGHGRDVPCAGISYLIIVHLFSIWLCNELMRCEEDVRLVAQARVMFASLMKWKSDGGMGSDHLYSNSLLT